MSRRTERVAEVVRQVVSTAALFEVKDPRVKDVTITRAEVSGDLRHATVYLTVRGDEKRERLTMRGLESARGFIQKKVADRLQTRFTPTLTFAVDESLADAVEVARVIEEELAKSATAKENAPTTIENSDDDSTNSP